MSDATGSACASAETCSASRPSDAIPCAPLPATLRRMAEGKRSRAWLWILLGAGVFFIFVFAIFALLYFSLRETGESAEYGGGFGDKIAVVDLEGVITEAKPAVTQLRRYGNDDSIKAI